SVGAPPWPAPADTASAVRAAGLSLDPEMGTAMHIHQKLRIVVDGAEVPVAQNIGVDAAGRMSGLHTHDSTGIVHVESATVRDFTLGQLFQEWRVPLGEGRIGTFAEGKKDARVEAFVNGKKATGSLASIRLKDRQDIAIVVTRDGSAPTAPTPFDWSTAS
ncbi:MAG: hypothetical protein HY996_01010, partial [Micrococcales bacterium]|nr:hypothetical protein [Micrococcales bacterium]